MAEHSDGQAVRRACHHVMRVPVCMCVYVISGGKILRERGGRAWGVALPLANGARRAGRGKAG